MYFRKVAIALCSSIMLIMLVCMLFRLFNGKDAFVGLSRLYVIVQGLDFWKPFVEMYDSLSSTAANFNTSVFDFSSISNIGEFFTTFGNFFVNLLDMIVVPVKVIYYVLYFFVNLGYQFAQFLRMVVVD